LSSIPINIGYCLVFSRDRIGCCVARESYPIKKESEPYNNKNSPIGLAAGLTTSTLLEAPHFFGTNPCGVHPVVIALLGTIAVDSIWYFDGFQQFYFICLSF
jgi:hypothetical protein